MNNMDIYNKVREVPKDAQKTIAAGRLKGFTDINPMWRIKILTEQFGPCGLGWYTEITNQWTVEGANGEVKAFVNLNLYLWNGNTNSWSAPISGNGGSAFASNERNGLYVDDECFKKAETDALGSACKKLGIGADVYWQADRSKYDKPAEQTKTPKAAAKVDPHVASPTEVDRMTIIKSIRELCDFTHVTEQQILDKFNKNREEGKYTCLGEFTDTDLFAANRLLEIQKTKMGN